MYTFRLYQQEKNDVCSINHFRDLNLKWTFDIRLRDVNVHVKVIQLTQNELLCELDEFTVFTT